MILTKEQAKALTDKTLSLSKAEETLVTLTGNDRANLRFARNTATTSGASPGIRVSPRTKPGSGTVSASRKTNTSPVACAAPRLRTAARRNPSSACRTSRTPAGTRGGVAEPSSATITSRRSRGWSWPARAARHRASCAGCS